MSIKYSAIYVGRVRHRRMIPKQNNFAYRVFMMYLDLEEVDAVLKLSRWWSKAKFALARFKRDDFHGDASLSIDQAVRNTVEERTGIIPQGPIRMLVNLRYFGYNMNPLSTYYCFAEDGLTLTHIVAEVHNTPWGQRHAYVLSVDSDERTFKAHFEKCFHVSPFNPVNMQYYWRSTTPAEKLAIHIENWQDQQKVMDATISLERQKVSAQSLNKIIVQFPFMTVKVIGAIYWQALRLWLKRVPYFSNPHCKNADKQSREFYTALEKNKHEVN